jgi:DNA-binding transcriptional MerR regulator
MTNDWSIQQIAKLAGTTSRTLRHYGDIGLLEPSRIGANGYRYYDAPALTRLQRILLLRDLGLGLPAIADALAAHGDSDALEVHLRWLETERARIDRQIASVTTTITTMKEGGQLMAEEMLDGFDHTQYKNEVTERWGAAAYADSAAWWKTADKDEPAKLAKAWTDAAAARADPASVDAQALAGRQFSWLRQIPGTPGFPTGPTRDYWLGLADLYVSDERFAANYGGVEGASFVREAMRVFAKTRWSSSATA